MVGVFIMLIIIYLSSVSTWSLRSDWLSGAERQSDFSSEVVQKVSELT